MWKEWNYRLFGALIFASVCSWTCAAEPPDTGQEDWTPLDIDSASLNTLLGEVNVNGPQLLSQEFTPYRASGVLEGCGFAYQVLLQDWAYRSNQPTIAYGSVVFFMDANRAPFLSLRIALTDIEQRENALWQKSSSVHYAYLRHGAESTAGNEQQIVDGEGGAKNFVYIDQEFEKFTWLITGDFLTVGFNRQAGGSDLEFKLPIMFTEAWQDLGDCFRELSER